VAAKTQRLAAIDIGSNALRLVLAELGADGKLEVTENRREPVRLGHDVFLKGAFSEATLERALAAILDFSKAIQKFGAEAVRAVATSAVREAANRDLFLDRVLQSTGIEVQIIPGAEEARLTYLAAANRIDLTKSSALLVDVGGGSVEVTLVQNGEIVFTTSHSLGAVRLLELLSSGEGGEAAFHKLAREYTSTLQGKIRSELRGQPVESIVAMGGNAEALADLGPAKRDDRGTATLTRTRLKELIAELAALSYHERIEKWGLREDRADVILPAALVYDRVAATAKTDTILVPFIGVKDGLLLDLVDELHGDRRTGVRRTQVRQAAIVLGRKYQFDESHARQAARLALLLFDATAQVHRLDEEARLILELAALLHDVGHFVEDSSHHKHSYYLIANSEIGGLTATQSELIANVARYHRKAFPKPSHPPWAALPRNQRLMVSKLAGLLRIADALDQEHDSKVIGLQVEIDDKRLVIKPNGESDMALERWSVQRKAELFEEVAGLKVKLAS
jgi:exopolyphosphatase/guanosine-5'-triphosphate,3'-diphosphate pyrophosphatase